MTLMREVTKEKYKYYPESLPDGTVSPVVIRCDFCTNEFTMGWRTFVREVGRNSQLHACRKCTQVLQHYVKTDRLADPVAYREEFIRDYLRLEHVDFEETRRLYRYDPRKVGYNEVESRMMAVIECTRCRGRYPVRLSGLSKYSGYNGLCLKCGKQTSEKILHKQEAPRESGEGLTESEKYPGVFRQATIDKLGVDPDTLATNSGSTVIGKCCVCGGPTETKLGYFNQKSGRVSCSKECRKTLYHQNMAAR
jgi:hypothetical protein